MKRDIAVAQSESFFMLTLRSKLTELATEIVKRPVRQKKTFPHIVSMPREVAGARHHEFGTWAVSALSKGSKGVDRLSLEQDEMRAGPRLLRPDNEKYRKRPHAK